MISKIRSFKFKVKMNNKNKRNNNKYPILNKIIKN